MEIALPDKMCSEDAVMPGTRDWHLDTEATCRCGDEWLAQERSLLLSVPSATVGRSFNWLFNPLHP